MENVSLPSTNENVCHALYTSIIFGVHSNSTSPMLYVQLASKCDLDVTSTASSSINDSVPLSTDEVVKVC